MQLINSTKILGNRVDCFRDYRELFDFVLANIKNQKIKKGYITVNNVHTMIEGYKDSHFQDIINNGYLSLPDGKPLEIVGRLKGSEKISRLFGPTVMETFIDWGRKEELIHFFLGSSESTLLKLKQSIIDKFPGTIISGMMSPPFTPIEEWDHKKIIGEISEAKPDIIWVGVGAPKQERWMSKYYRDVDNGIMFGIGAGFDYLAGKTKHAPQWMKNASLEWLFRLIQEPRRLWKRYLSTIPKFLVLAGLELIGVKPGRNK